MDKQYWGRGFIARHGYMCAIFHGDGSDPKDCNCELGYLREKVKRLTTDVWLTPEEKNQLMTDYPELFPLQIKKS